MEVIVSEDCLAISFSKLQPYINANMLSEMDADVLALNQDNGTERWRATIPSTPDDTEAVPTTGFARVGDLLYVGGAALDPADGSSVWWESFPTEPYWRLLAVAGGRAYLRGTSYRAPRPPQTLTVLTVAAD